MSTNETDRDPNSEPNAEPNAEPAPATGSSATDDTSDASAVASAEPSTDAPDSTESDEPPATTSAEATSTSVPWSATSTAATGAATASSKAPRADTLTPGQRLAAQKAAKAAKKAADKTRRSEEAAAAADTNEALSLGANPVPAAPDEVEIRTAEVRGLVEKNSLNLTKLAALAVVGIAIFGAVTAYVTYRNEAAGTLLERAVVAARAEIGDAPEIDDGRVRFRSEAARDRRAVSLFRKVVSTYPSTEAARRAYLGRASILIAQEKFPEALADLARAKDGLDDDDVALSAALSEATGVVYLGQHKYTEATREFENLRRVDRGRYKNLADYLLARVLFDRGDANGAKTKLTALLRRLDATGALPMDHVQDQARSLLRRIDPSAMPAPAFSPDSLSQEQLMQMLRQQGLNLGGGGGQ